jgi:hypothetical protein
MAELSLDLDKLFSSVVHEMEGVLGISIIQGYPTFSNPPIVFPISCVNWKIEEGELLEKTVSRNQPVRIGHRFDLYVAAGSEAGLWRLLELFRKLRRDYRRTTFVTTQIDITWGDPQRSTLPYQEETLLTYVAVAEFMISWIV